MSDKDEKPSLLTSILGKLNFLNVIALGLLVFAIVNLLAK